MNPNKLYCTCGATVGKMEFSHIDPSIKTFDGGKVYKNVYNGNEARDKDGALIPLRYGRYQCKKCQQEESQDLRYGRYQCKKCQQEESQDLKTWIATYTNDHGMTTKSIQISEKNYTRACLAAALKIDGMVIDLVEVKDA